MTFTRRTCLLLLPPALRAATTGRIDLAEKWRQIAGATEGTVGAAAMHLGSGQHAVLNADGRFPLASVCKLPIGANILSLVDEGKLRLDQRIEVLPQDICPGVSAVAERWPGRKQCPSPNCWN